MTKKGDLNGLIYQQHKPGVRIKENGLKHWYNHLGDF